MLTVDELEVEDEDVDQTDEADQDITDQE